LFSLPWPLAGPCFALFVVSMCPRTHYIFHFVHCIAHAFSSINHILMILHWMNIIFLRCSSSAWVSNFQLISLAGHVLKIVWVWWVRLKFDNISTDLIVHVNVVNSIPYYLSSHIVKMLVESLVFNIILVLYLCGDHPAIKALSRIS